MICKAVRILERLATGTDVLQVTVDNHDALMYFKYDDALKFLNKEVIVEYRDDLYGGKIEQFITTITTLAVVNTLSREDGIKLYIDEVYNHSDTAFMDIEMGESRQACTVYCTAMEFDSSPNFAQWIVLTIVDKFGRIAKARLFDYNPTTAELAGKYILVDLKRNKFGFSITSAVSRSAEIPINPEVTIAKKYILQRFSDDSEMFEVLGTTRILEAIEKKVVMEMGYELCYMAHELDLVSELRNTSPNLDIKSMMRAVVYKRMYMRQDNVDYSNAFQNIAAIANARLDKKKILINLVDENPNYESSERLVFKGIQTLVKTIIETRKCIVT